MNDADDAETMGVELGLLAADLEEIADRIRMTPQYVRRSEIDKLAELAARARREVTQYQLKLREELLKLG